MKKIMFIMILATTFIPLPQISASNKGMNDQYRLKTNVPQIMVKQASDKLDLLSDETQLQPVKIRREARIKNTSWHKERLAKKKISSSKRDRLFGLLLLAYGIRR